MVFVRCKSIHFSQRYARKIIFVPSNYELDSRVSYIASTKFAVCTAF